MGKKNNDIPNPNSVANRDIIQRLNFLYQASVLLNGMTAGASSQVPCSPCEADDAHNRPKKRRRKVVSTADLSRSYVDTMKVVGQKTNVKIDPTVKRVICKGCNIILIPGASSTVRVKSSTSHGHLIVYTCNSCRTSRRIPAPPVLGANEPQMAQPASVEKDQPGPETTTGSASRPALCEQMRKKKPRAPRLPLHFAREGHIVFRGNERLLDAVL
ncbi:Rpr2-domain-containing protein [Rhizopogon vinicolor AM-OR11-026]|uniref:Rpr2-domain-containing protein n=1 Tax=Rhizopogon vinicolor AM-OR11-026 TaxID=1314800 RepID=A0A1B7NGQ2_9AGAM|nr:Rpr2-domain-containing protein [Rhizopogon vinicolor AM-OR11-026]